MSIFGRQAQGTGAQSPECRHPAPGTPSGQWEGSSVDMSLGTQTAAAGAGLQDTELQDTGLVRHWEGSPGSGWRPAEGYGH